MIPATSRDGIYPGGTFFTQEGAKQPSPKGHLKGSGEWASFVKVIKSFKADFPLGPLDHISKKFLFSMKWLNL